MAESGRGGLAHEAPKCNSGRRGLNYSRAFLILRLRHSGAILSLSYQARAIYDPVGRKCKNFFINTIYAELSARHVSLQYNIGANWLAAPGLIGTLCQDRDFCKIVFFFFSPRIKIFNYIF